MQGKSRVCLVFVIVVVTVVSISGSVSQAAPLKRLYNAVDARLVPALYRDVTLQVATDATYAPDESMSGTEMVGFDVQLIHAIATTLGLKISEDNVTFANIISQVTSGKYQIGISSFPDTRASERRVNLVDYFQAGEGAYVKSDSTFNFARLSSLCGHSVGVVEGTVEQMTAQVEVKSCPSSKKLVLRSFITQGAVRLAVLTGQTNVAFVDSQIAGYQVATAKGQLKTVGRVLDVVRYGIVTQRSSAGDGLAVAIQWALKSLITNGTYRAILAKWGVSAGALKPSDIRVDRALL